MFESNMAENERIDRGERPDSRLSSGGSPPPYNAGEPIIQTARHSETLTFA